MNPSYIRRLDESLPECGHENSGRGGMFSDELKI